MCCKIAQSVKYSLQKSEDLSLTPRMHIKMPCVGKQEMLRMRAPLNWLSNPEWSALKS